MTVDTVWVVIERVRFEDQSLTLVAASASAAKAAVHDYVGVESLDWKRLNSMPDSQDMWHAEHDGDDYYIHEEMVCR